MIKKLFSALMVVLCLSANAQYEYLAVVNPTTGVHTKIDSIPCSDWVMQGGSTYDKINKRYIYQGIDCNGNNRLFCVSTTGSVLSQPTFTTFFTELHYSNTLNKIFAFSNSNNQTFVSEINIATAAITTLIATPENGIASGSTYLDEINNKLIFQASNNIYIANLVNHSLTTVPSPSVFNLPLFDNSTGIAYGVLYSSPNHKLVKFNPTNSTYTTVTTLTTSSYSDDHFSFDEINHRYTFESGNYLYSISVATGSIVLNPLFPVGLTGPENVIELHYDNIDGKLYALHWGPIDASVAEYQSDGSFKIFPNPSNGIMKVLFKKTHTEITVNIFNSLGQAVSSEKISNANTFVIHQNNLTNGEYIIVIRCDHEAPKRQKIIITH